MKITLAERIGCKTYGAETYNLVSKIILWTAIVIGIVMVIVL